MENFHPTYRNVAGLVCSQFLPDYLQVHLHHHQGCLSSFVISSFSSSPQVEESQPQSHEGLTARIVTIEVSFPFVAHAFSLV